MMSLYNFNLTAVVFNLVFTSVFVSTVFLNIMYEFFWRYYDKIAGVFYYFLSRCRIEKNYYLFFIFGYDLGYSFFFKTVGSLLFAFLLLVFVGWLTDDRDKKTGGPEKNEGGSPAPPAAPPAPPSAVSILEEKLDDLALENKDLQGKAPAPSAVPVVEERPADPALENKDLQDTVSAPSAETSPLDGPLYDSLRASVASQSVFNDLEPAFNFFEGLLKMNRQLVRYVKKGHAVPESDHQDAIVAVLGFFRSSIRYMILSLVRDAWIMNHPSYKDLRDRSLPYAHSDGKCTLDEFNRLVAQLDVNALDEFGPTRPTDLQLKCAQSHFGDPFLGMELKNALAICARLSRVFKEIHLDISSNSNAVSINLLREKVRLLERFRRLGFDLEDDPIYPSSVSKNNDALLWILSRESLLTHLIAFAEANPHLDISTLQPLQPRPDTGQAPLVGIDLVDFLSESGFFLFSQSKVFASHLEFSMFGPRYAADIHPRSSELLSSIASSHFRVNSAIAGDLSYPKSRELLLESEQFTNLILPTAIESFESQSFLYIYFHTVKKVFGTLKDFF